jgi:conjugative transfer signal peptidase TraF
VASPRAVNPTVLPPEERPPHPDLMLLLAIEHLQQGQQRLETEVQHLAPLLEQIIALLDTPKEPPAPPIASYASLYAHEVPLAVTDKTAEVVPACVEHARMPPQRGGWRRLFASRSSRVFGLAALLAVGALPWYRVNVTSSAPRGVWRMLAVPPVVEKGMWVTLPAPASVKAWAPHWANLLKPVAAVAGEPVCVTRDTLWIRGESFGRVLKQDAEGTPLPRLREGCVVVAAGTVFLASAAPQSLDSRYFGSVPVAALTARALPLLTWR